MVVSFLVAIYFQFVHTELGFEPLHPSLMLVAGVAITTASWLVVTMLTPATDTATLQSFYDKIRPMGRGWRKVVQAKPRSGEDSVSAALLCWFLGCVVVYGALFGTGYFLYGEVVWGSICAIVVVIAGFGLFNALPKVGFK